MEKYSYTRKIDLGFLEALDEVRFVFADNGFGVVSNVNVSERINKKIDSNFKNYTILGVCNPDLAYKYLSYNMELGVFMPCSVAIYEKEDGIYVSAGLPDILAGDFIKDESLVKLSNELSTKMKFIVDSI